MRAGGSPETGSCRDVTESDMRFVSETSVNRCHDDNSPMCNSRRFACAIPSWLPLPKLGFEFHRKIVLHLFHLMNYSFIYIFSECL